MSDGGRELVDLTLVLLRLRQPPAQQLPRLIRKEEAPACARLLDQHVESFSGGFVPERSQTARALLLVSMLARAGLIGARVQQELKGMILACERFPFALLDTFEAQPTLYPLLEPLREAFGDRLEESMPLEAPGGDAAATEEQKEITASIQVERMVWECTGGVLCGFTADYQACERVTAVLLDSLVATKSGRADPVSALDWRWRIDNTPWLLKKRAQGTSLVIVAVPPAAASADFDQWKMTFQGRIEGVSSALGIPCVAVAPLNDDGNRPPGAGLWAYLMQSPVFASTAVSRALSTIVGEAGGREGDSHDGRDRKWARNEEVPFATGATFLLRKQPRPFRLTFDPHRLLCEEASTATNPWPGPKLETQRLLILVGSPSSGKSHWCRHAEHPFVCVTNSTACSAALQKGCSVVVDGRHPSVGDRAQYVALGRSLGVVVECLLLSTSGRLARHLNRLRAVCGERASPREELYAYEKIFVSPSVVEGFAEVYDQPFLPKALDPRFFQFLL